MLTNRNNFWEKLTHTDTFWSSLEQSPQHVLASLAGDTRRKRKPDIGRGELKPSRRRRHKLQPNIRSKY